MATRTLKSKFTDETGATWDRTVTQTFDEHGTIVKTVTVDRQRGTGVTFTVTDDGEHSDIVQSLT